MKQSKQDALAKVLPKKSLKSNTKKQPPVPEPSQPERQVVPRKNVGIVKEDLICKILKYQNNVRFGPIIKNELGFKYTRAQLSKYSIDNLETILHRIRTHLNTRNMDQVFQHMVQVTAKGYEDLVTGFGYNIDGFSEMLLANPAFHDAFERWKIEKKIPDIPPSFQLMYIVAMTTYMAHSENVMKNPIQQKVQPEPLKIKKEMVQEKTNEQEKEKEDRLKSKMQPGDIII